MNCSESESVNIPFKTQLIGKVLYLTINGITKPQDLSSLGGGSGGVNIEKKTVIPITEANQIYFNNVIPLNEILIEIIINGQIYNETTENESGSYIVVDRNLTWTGAFALETSDTLILKTWQSSMLS